MGILSIMSLIKPCAIQFAGPNSMMLTRRLPEKEVEAQLALAKGIDNGFESDYEDDPPMRVRSGGHTIDVVPTSVEVEDQPYVRFMHLRYHFDADYPDACFTCDEINNPFGFSGRGGVTVAYLVEDKTVKYAFALCRLTDNFCRRTGRQIAKGRLLSPKGEYYRAGIEAVEVRHIDAAVATVVLPHAYTKVEHRNKADGYNFGDNGIPEYLY
jgi:hypothetical protein